MPTVTVTEPSVKIGAEGLGADLARRAFQRATHGDAGLVLNPPDRAWVEPR